MISRFKQESISLPERLMSSAITPQALAPEKAEKKIDAKGRVGLTVEGDGVENPLKKPSEKGPDGVAGGMGDAEKVGGNDEFAGIFETNGGLEGEGVND